MIPPDYTDFIDIDGQRVTIRTIRPEDRHIEAEFVKALSLRSRYNRFHGALMSALSQQMLDHFIHPDYPNEMALIATILNHNKEQKISVARYARTRALKWPATQRSPLLSLMSGRERGLALGC